MEPSGKRFFRLLNVLHTSKDTCYIRNSKSYIRNPKWFLYGIATIEQRKKTFWILFIFMCSTQVQTRLDLDSRVQAKCKSSWKYELESCNIALHCHKTSKACETDDVKKKKMQAHRFKHHRLNHSTSLSIIHLTRGQKHNIPPSNRKPQMSFSWRITSFRAKMWPCSHGYLL